MNLWGASSHPSSVTELDEKSDRLDEIRDLVLGSERRIHQRLVKMENQISTMRRAGDGGGGGDMKVLNTSDFDTTASMFSRKSNRDDPPSVADNAAEARASAKAAMRLRLSAKNVVKGATKSRGLAAHPFARPLQRMVPVSDTSPPPERATPPPEQATPPGMAGATFTTSAQLFYSLARRARARRVYSTLLLHASSPHGAKAGRLAQSHCSPSLRALGRRGVYGSGIDPRAYHHGESP